LTRYADEIIASDYTVNPWSPETAPRLEVGAVDTNRPGD
jgi:hypothetical protein